MQQRREEIQAKKARLEELKRQRKLRQDQFAQSKPSEDGSTYHSPAPNRVSSNREELDSLISTLVGDSRPASAGAREPVKGSRPNSVLSAGELSLANSGSASPSATSAPTFQPQTILSPQPLSTAPLFTLYEFAPAPVKEVFTYSKGVQTTEPWSPPPPRSPDDFFHSDVDGSPLASKSSRHSKRLSRRGREQDEELRETVRREIEEETKRNGGASDGLVDGSSQPVAQSRLPIRPLSEAEVNAVTSSHDFLDFLEKSSKVVERALDQEYDVLADYALAGSNELDDDDEDLGGGQGKGKRKVKEVAQFWDERWSRKRMISGLGFSPKFPELVLASYTKNPSAPNDPDGLVQVWNMHLHDRPEFVFHAQSDILVAKFSPFHPNLIIGGAYSGQVLLWDTRAKSAPVQKTPLTGSGHTHPVYAVDMIGTQNANNIISCSTDGVVCGWTVDMLAQPQEYISLMTPPPSKTEDLSPTCMAFPRTDPTYFLVGTEEGSIYPCHRYDRAGAKAGVDQRINYRGHAAPVMSMDFHPARGPVDLGDLVLSSSLDWSVKIWKVRAPTGASSTSTAAGSTTQTTAPLLDITREDLVYDAAWSPIKPGVFSLVDGGGNLEIWDITRDTEIPMARIQPSRTRLNASSATLLGGSDPHNKSSSLNRVKWEEHEGKRLAVGGLDGVVTVFDVSSELGGLESARAEEWSAVKKLVHRLDTNGLGTGLAGYGSGTGMRDVFGGGGGSSSSIGGGGAAFAAATAAAGGGLSSGMNGI
ncbi:MAG: hypothetical protein M1838_000075 [Thelocarpon superellum]|nr:MAG: hypothetical protein M1838_000075 [Thelocarpon superellum]